MTSQIVHAGAEAVTEVKVPSSAPHHLQPTVADAASAAESVSTKATAHNGRWRQWRLRWLSPSTDIDVGAIDYASAPPRVFSVEYLFGALALGSINVYGFVVLRRFCAAHPSPLYDVVVEPYALFKLLGSKGYDSILDNSLVAYTESLWIFFLLGVGLGIGSRLCRWIAAAPPHARGLKLFSHAKDEAVGSPMTSTKSDSLSTTSSTLWNSEAPTTVDTPLRVWHAEHIRAGRHVLLPLFYIVVGLIFTTILHGPHFFVPLLLTLANYIAFTRLQRWCSYRVFMAVMWITHVALLHIIERCEGFEHTYVLQYLFPTSIESSTRALGPDNARHGLWDTRMRWYAAYRMTALRLIAFNYDLWEATHCAVQARERAADRHDTACVECAQLREQNSSSSSSSSTASVPAEASRCYKYRTECARDAADYSLVNYLAYVVFPPLYLAGPMSSFNAFVSHMRVPSTAISWRSIVLYALRTLGIFLTLCALLHFVFIPGISTYTFLTLEMTSVEQSHFFFYSLAYIWLKFSFIWKSSRLFAMFSGIEVPEDVRRCFCNTLTIREYWRDWHASFNLWIVRYMYIPMGGRPRVALSVLPIFLFIALWHDPALQLIKWALCIAAMFVVELLVSAGFSAVSAVFSREMAATTAAGDEEKEGAAAAADDDTPHTPQRSRHGGVAAVVRPAARFAARHMSPRMRAWCYRMLRVVAGMFTVFGLIVANLTGYSMQNSSATLEKVDFTSIDADADHSIVRSLRNSSVPFALGLVLALYSLSSLAAIDRDFGFHRTKMLKERFGLK